MPIILHLVSDLTADLNQILENLGERVVTAYSVGDVLQEIIRKRADIIIIPDQNEPVEGVALLPVIRRMTNQPIVLVGGADPNQQAQALLQGADMYLKLPLRPSIATSRLRTLLRPRRNRNGSSQSVKESGASEEPRFKIDLSPTEDRLLSALMSAEGAFVSANDLATEVWGGPTKLESLRFYVARLRAKLTDTPTVRILNQKGLGYRIEYQAPQTATV